MLDSPRKVPWLKLMIQIWIKAMFSRVDYSLDVYKFASREGTIVRTIGVGSYYFINTPEAISHVLNKNAPNYSKGDVAFGGLTALLGPGIFTNSGEVWQCSRKQIQPNFHHKPVTNALPCIVKTTEKLLDRWTMRQGQTVDLTHEIPKWVLDVTAKILFGADIDKDIEQVIPELEFINRYLWSGNTHKYKLPTSKNRRYHHAQRLINGLVQKMLIPPHPNNTNSTEAILQCFWIQPDSSPEQQHEYMGEARNFFIAVHETVGFTLYWTLYLLAKHPTILNELLKEVDSVLQGDPPTLEQTNHLNFTTMVIEETMRLYPPSWIIERQVIEEDIVEGYRIPAKSRLVILPYTLHRNPKYWDDPETFNPQRFNKNNPVSYPKNAYIPFGLGPRVCVGRQLALLMLKTSLPMILQRFELLIDPDIDVDIKFLFTLKADGPIPLKLKPRTCHSTTRSTDIHCVDN